MNKSELVSKMAELAGVTKVQVERGLDALIQAITEAVEKGEAIKLVGFGSFEVVKRAEKAGRMNWGTTMPFPEKFLHNKKDTMYSFGGSKAYQKWSPCPSLFCKLQPYNITKKVLSKT